MSPWRVLQVIDSLALGGAERMAVELANLADRHQVEMHLVATRAGGPLEAELADHVRFTRLDRRSRWDVAGAVALARYARRHRIDVVHSHGVSSMTFVSLLRCLGGLRAGHVFHDHLGLELPLGRTAALAVALGVDVYLAVDRVRFEHVGGRVAFRPGTSRVVRNGIDTQRYAAAEPIDGLRRQLDIPPDHLLLVSVANLRPKKDHEVLLEAMAAARQGSRMTLLVVGAAFGDDYEARVRSRLAALGLADRVRFLGGRRDVPALLRSCDVGVLSSAVETGPLAVLEYLAAGLPVVTTDTGEVVAGLHDLPGVVRVPPRDAVALARALDEVAGWTADRRAELGRAHTVVAGERFDQQVTVAEVLEAYRMAVDLRTRRASRLRRAYRTMRAPGWREPWIDPLAVRTPAGGVAVRST